MNIRKVANTGTPIKTAINKPVTSSELKDKVELLLRTNNFIRRKEKDYDLWKLSGSESTLFLRTYNSKLKCLLFGDFEPYIYKEIKYLELFNKLELGENLFQLLLTEK